MTYPKIRAGVQGKQAIAIGFLVCALADVGIRPGSADTLEQRLPSCLACHGESGTSANPEVPSLGGQPAPYMVIQLFLFRERMRSIEVMNETTRGITDNDLEALAGLLARLPPPAAQSEPGDPARLDRGRALINKHRCNFCHQADLSGRDNVPRIADQREDYLLKALREYKNNTRPGYDASMADVVQPLNDEDIRDLAYFAARQK
jgi:cytochrome c553